MVFFGAAANLWHTPSRDFLRRVVVNHLTTNTSLDVELRFGSAASPEFEKFIRQQRPTFVLTCRDESVGGEYFWLTYLQYKALGQTCVDFAGLSPDMANLNGWILNFEFDIKRLSTHIGDTLRATEQRLEAAKVNGLADARLWSEMIGSVSFEGGVLGRLVQLIRYVCKNHEVKSSVYQYYIASLQILIIADVIKRHESLSSRLTFGHMYSVANGSDLAKILNNLYYAVGEIVQNGDLNEQLPDMMDSQLILKLFLKFKGVVNQSNFLKFYASESGGSRGVSKELSNIDAHLQSKGIHLSDTRLAHFPQLCQSIVTNKLDRSEVNSPNKIVPVDSELYRKYVADVDREELNTMTEEEKMQFQGRHKQFVERYHWHTFRKLSDEYERIYEAGQNKGYMALQRHQMYAKFAIKYGESIEGRIATDRPIAVEESRKKNERNEKQSALKLKVKNVQDSFKNQAEKLSLRVKKAKDAKSVEEELVSVKKAQKEFENKLKVIPGFEPVKSEIESFFVCKALELQIKLCRNMRKSFEVAKSTEEKIQLKINLLQVAKQLKDHTSRLSKDEVAKLAKCLKVMEFGGLAVVLGLVEGEATASVDDLADFQLRHMSYNIERDLPTDADPRIDDFIPDHWQRMLFDAIDERNSALIVAPTSSGKTFASYYCMETILRESNEGVVIYVAPTKALVNQVSATVAARFSQRKKNLPPGKTVSGTFTREVRENVLNCQILVTVPQCLEILLLSPRRTKWIQNIRYVIFDEVHNIGAESDGEFWEHNLSLIRCPFLALSATIENPTYLHKWFTDLEQFKKIQDVADGRVREKGSYNVTLVVYKERHSYLENFVYSPHKEERLQKVHPLAALNLGNVKKDKSIPGHIILSPKDCLEFYEAMESVFRPKVVSPLKPAVYFGEKLLRRQDICEYGCELKSRFVKFLADSKNQAKCSRVLEALTPGSRISQEDEKMFKEQKYLAKELPSFTTYLKSQGLLPAIVFAFDRKYCEEFAKQSAKLCQRERLDITQTADYQKRLKDEKKVEEAKEKVKKQQRDINSNMQKGEDNREKTQKRKKDWESAGAVEEDCHLRQLTAVHKKFPGQTFVGKHSLSDQDAKFILEKLNGSSLSFKSCLENGISWHHAGNSRSMRESTEILFRSKFVSLCYSTTTLAQGIHMPCKTVVIAGNSVFLNSLNFHQCSGRAGRRGLDQDGKVVFIGVPSQKIARVTSAKLPMLLGNKPLTVTLVLRLFIMTSDEGLKKDVGNEDEERVRDMVSRALCLLENPFIIQQEPLFRYVYLTSF